ncbi:MAG: hypothetical protein ACKOWF_10935 [Chloroflexota bacterium]
MDHSSFDRIARLLGGAASRRAGLGAVFGVLAGLAAAPDLKARPRRGAAPRRSAKPAGPCGDGSGAANHCAKDSDCCTGYCKKARSGKGGRCRCIKRGKPCTTTQTCCGGGRCTDGTCPRRNTGPKPPRPVATGRPCTVGKTVCSRTGAACVVYAGGASAQTYCLLPDGAACEQATDCVQGYCGSGGCAVRPTSWVQQSEIATADTAGIAGVTSSANGLTLYLPGYTAGVITIWERPGRTGADASAWTRTATLGSPGAAPGQLKFPWSISLTGDERTMLVSDSYNTGDNSVSMWQGSGGSWSYVSRFGDPGLGTGPAALTRDGLTLYLADYSKSKVQIWTRPDAASSAWTQQSSFAGSGPNQVSSPMGIALTPDELMLLISDSNNNQVVIWSRPSRSSQNWTYQDVFGGAGTGDGLFAAPAGLSIAPNGLTAWIADLNNNRIQVWTRPDIASTTWTYLSSFGTVGSGVGEMTRPYWPAISGGGQFVYVADSGGNRVTIWTEA